ncbi:hypothetical protein B0B52_05760 [Polaromonas sp. A23]|nr:hypothetical protein B0B52_05760 [Polaromonas sp. A23]
MMLVGVVLALLPISSALVHPLMETACNANGRVVQLSSAPFSAGAVVISGRHYSASSVVDLLATRQIGSVHVMPTAEYGDARRIATTAEIHDGRAFSLRASRPDDPACAPYYEMLARSGASPAGYDGVCAAFGYEPPPKAYFKVSELHRRERSWRTAFHEIEWEGVQLEQVSEGNSQPLLEVREFKHPGFPFPLLLGVTPIGNFACRADKNAQSAVASVMPANTVPHKPVSYSKTQLAKQLKLLDEHFWGFRFPTEVHRYEISVFDHEHHAKGGNALDIQIDVQHHELPVLLSLSNNARANWTVTGDTGGQRVLVATGGVSPELQHVVGVPESQVWSRHTDLPSTPPLHKFYLSRAFTTTRNSIEAGRNCQVTHVAKGITTRISVQGCPMVVK